MDRLERIVEEKQDKIRATSSSLADCEVGVRTRIRQRNTLIIFQMQLEDAKIRLSRFISSAASASQDLNDLRTRAADDLQAARKAAEDKRLSCHPVHPPDKTTTQMHNDKMTLMRQEFESEVSRKTAEVRELTLELESSRRSLAVGQLSMMLTAIEGYFGA